MKRECLITDINRNIILFYSIEVYNTNKLFLSIYIMNKKKKRRISNQLNLNETRIQYTNYYLYYLHLYIKYRRNLISKFLVVHHRIEKRSNWRAKIKNSKKTSERKTSCIVQRAYLPPIISHWRRDITPF